MSQTNTISPNIVRGLEEVWQPLCARAGVFNNELDVKVATQNGRALLNAVKSDFETSYLLKMTKILQQHANMSEAQIRVFSQKANEGLERITMSLFNPARPGADTVKDQLKMAVSQMADTMKNLEKVTQPKPWLNQVVQANLGKLASPRLSSGKQSLRQDLQISALQHFSQQAHSLRESVPQNERAAFNELLTDITAELSSNFRLQGMDKNLPARLMVQLMDHQISTALGALSQQVPPADSNMPPAPQFSEITFKVRGANNVETDEKAYVMMREAPLENLVFRGGGAKGRGYLKTMEVMLRTRMFDNVKNIAGSSAGALTAVGLGFGLNAKELADFTENISAGLKTDVPETISKHPTAYTMLEKIMPTGSGERAAGVVQTIDQMTAERVSSFLHGRALVARNGEPAFSASEVDRLAFLCKGYTDLHRRISDGTSCRTDAAVTFNDVSLLRRMEGGEQFKQLTLTTWSQDKKQTILLNAETVPHMPLALAARASMALPWYFTGLTMNLARYADNPSDADLAQNSQKYFDGGVAMNLPTTVFIPSEESGIHVEERQAKTMSFLFDEDGASEVGQAKQGRMNTRFKNWFIGLAIGHITGNPLFGKNYYFKIKEENERIATLGNVMIVGHGTLDTSTFEPTAEQLRIADAVAEARAEQCVLQRKHQAYNVIVKTDEQAVALMSKKEMIAFRAEVRTNPAMGNNAFFRDVDTLCAKKLGQAPVQQENA